jgi:hypothetical protein
VESSLFSSISLGRLKGFTAAPILNSINILSY